MLSTSVFKSIHSKCLNYSTLAQKTSLYDFHIKNGAKMVTFANFKLPLVYRDLSSIDSHLHTRKFASIFDVSHMLQTEITGSGSRDFVESVCPTDCGGMQNGSSRYTLFLDDITGGILDDLILTKINERSFFVVSNASRRDYIQQFLKNKSGTISDISLKFYTANETSLLAIQGPLSSACIQKLTTNSLSDMNFMQSRLETLADVPNCRITRCGYTGEDGFEVVLKASETEQVVTNLLKFNKNIIKLAGLGVRDSLRLEAGLCLYGRDIDDKINPVEASLSWVLSKKRQKLANYPGAQKINSVLVSGTNMARVGLFLLEKCPIPRYNYKIYNDAFEEVGYITSGSFSPILKVNIAMGYVLNRYTKDGSQLLVQMRDNYYRGQIKKLPFIKTNYYFVQNVTQ